MRTLYRAADARVAVSSEVAEDLARISGLERGRFTVIHNPIPHLPDAWGDRAEAEAEACWPGSGRRILTVGALKQQKNQMLLLRAFALVNAREPANLLILGEGELRPELERLARELGVADSVAMPGFRIDPAPFYASANLFVLASDYEGFGNVLIEALAAGTPVVSTDCQSGPREILEDGRYGRLVPVGDAEALATAIDAELGNPADPKLLRQRAWQFRPEVAIDHYLRLLIGEGERG